MKLFLSTVFTTIVLYSQLNVEMATSATGKPARPAPSLRSIFVPSQTHIANNLDL
jgi:hypothetical protein